MPRITIYSRSAQFLKFEREQIYSLIDDADLYDLTCGKVYVGFPLSKLRVNLAHMGKILYPVPIKLDQFKRVDNVYWTIGADSTKGEDLDFFYSLYYHILYPYHQDSYIVELSIRENYENPNSFDKEVLEIKFKNHFLPIVAVSTLEAQEDAGKCVSKFRRSDSFVPTIGVQTSEETGGK